MKREYKVRWAFEDIYDVVEVITTYGERTSAYDSEIDKVAENHTYQGDLANCYAYIKLREGGYMYVFNIKE